MGTPGLPAYPGQGERAFLWLICREEAAGFGAEYGGERAAVVDGYRAQQGEGYKAKAILARCVIPNNPVALVQ